MIDGLAVYKDAEGEVTVIKRTDLSYEEAAEFGATVGALMFMGAILVLAAGTGKEGPGPLVAGLGKTVSAYPIPVAIVPGHLGDEDLDALS